MLKQISKFAQRVEFHLGGSVSIIVVRMDRYTEVAAILADAKVMTHKEGNFFHLRVCTEEIL